MAYFDSAKNRALWKKEIERLKVEREKRRKDGFRPVEAVSGEEKGERLKRGVRRIDLKELERIVRQKKGLDITGEAPESGRRSHGRDLGRDRAATADSRRERESFIPAG